LGIEKGKEEEDLIHSYLEFLEKKRELGEEGRVGDCMKEKEGDIEESYSRD